MAQLILEKKCTMEGNQIIVPKEEFLKVISASTGFTESDLKSKTIGEIEEKLNLRAVKPVQLSSLKQGKSNSDLYEFKGYETRKRSDISSL